jgi:hypothetical protein
LAAALALSAASTAKASRPFIERSFHPGWA